MFFPLMTKRANWLVSMESTFLDLTKQTKQRLTQLWFYLKSKVFYSRLYTYDTITLRLFIEIAGSGQLNRLLIRGRASNDELVQAFENIVKRNSEVSGNFQYMTYFQLLKSYAQYIAEYTITRAMLIKLAYVLDFATIQAVRRRGYRINTQNTATYAESLTAGLHRVSNLITRATMKRKEIEKFNAPNDNNAETFESILANLSYNLGFIVPETITLAAYNEYKKIIRTRIAQQEKTALYGRNK